MDALRSHRHPLRFLVVGLGFLGRQRAAACRAARGSQLVAVMDVDQNLSQRESLRLGVRSETSLSVALKRDDIDAVVVATPHADHVRTVAASLAAGKHVLCEKPLTLRTDEASQLARQAQDTGLHLATGFNHRFYPPIRDALELVGKGRIGRVERVQGRIGHLASGSFLDGWHVDPAMAGGGTLIDNGPHICDLLGLVLGEILSVEAQTKDSLGLPFAIESDAHATFTAAGGAVGEVWSSWTQPTGYLSLDIQGESGDLRVDTAPWTLAGRLDDGQRINRRYILERIKERVARRRFGCERSLRLELEAFVARTGRNGSGWDGVRVTEMIEAAYRAAAIGGRISTATSTPRPSLETSNA